MGTKEGSMESYFGTWYHIITKLKNQIREGSTLTIQNSWKPVWLMVLGDLNFMAFWKDKTTIKTAKRIVAVRDWRRRVAIGRWNSVSFQDGKAVLHNALTVAMALYNCQSQRTYSPDSELSCKPGTPFLMIICHFYIQLFLGKPKSQAQREMGYLGMVSFLIRFL